jgi:hypothetical protein
MTQDRDHDHDHHSFDFAYGITIAEDLHRKRYNRYSAVSKWSSSNTASWIDYSNFALSTSGVNKCLYVYFNSILLLINHIYLHSIDYRFTSYYPTACLVLTATLVVRVRDPHFPSKFSFLVSILSRLPDPLIHAVDSSHPPFLVVYCAVYFV